MTDSSTPSGGQEVHVLLNVVENDIEEAMIIIDRMYLDNAEVKSIKRVDSASGFTLMVELRITHGPTDSGYFKNRFEEVVELTYDGEQNFLWIPVEPMPPIDQLDLKLTIRKQLGQLTENIGHMRLPANVDELKGLSGLLKQAMNTVPRAVPEATK